MTVVKQLEGLAAFENAALHAVALEPGFDHQDP